MLGGMLRVVTGLAATIGMWMFYAVLLPVAVMVVTLYLVRMVPLTGRRPRSG